LARAWRIARGTASPADPMSVKNFGKEVVIAIPVALVI
jgi:hypothetical protein